MIAANKMKKQSVISNLMGSFGRNDSKPNAEFVFDDLEKELDILPEDYVEQVSGGMGNCDQLSSAFKFSSKAPSFNMLPSLSKIGIKNSSKKISSLSRLRSNASKKNGM